MKTKFIFSGLIWSLGSGWAENSKILKKVKISVSMKKADYSKAYEMAYNLANKRGYKNLCIELEKIINL